MGVFLRAFVASTRQMTQWIVQLMHAVSSNTCYTALPSDLASLQDSINDGCGITFWRLAVASRTS